MLELVEARDENLDDDFEERDSMSSKQNSSLLSYLAQSESSEESADQVDAEDGDSALE